MFITGSITGAMGFAGRPLIFGRNPRLTAVSRQSTNTYMQRYYTMYIRLPIFIYLYNMYERYDIFVEYAYTVTTHTHTHTLYTYRYARNRPVDRRRRA